GLGDDALGDLGRDALRGVQLDLGERLGAFLGELLDLDATFDAAHREVPAGRAIQEDGEVVLLLDVRAGAEHHDVDRVALDVEVEDLGRDLHGLLLTVCQLHAASLAAAAGADL